MSDENLWEFDPLNSEIDKIWAGRASDSGNRFNNYYDYYFSGEDIRVYIDGLFDPQDELDIASFEFVIAQEKQPLYGFWSYNYDAMMLGTRIISGSFAVFTRHPRRMTELLEKAAKNRVASGKNRYKDYNRTSKDSIVSRLSSEGFTSEDEKNVEKYWSYSQLDRISRDPGISDRNIFSAHPPFNFVILYGVDEVSMTPFSAAMSPDLEIRNNFDRMFFTDINQRTVRTDNITSGMKIILQQVNLLNVSVMYAPGGMPIGERYSFIARDFYNSSTDLSFIKSFVTDVESDADSARDGLYADPSGSTTYNGGFSPDFPIFRS